MKGLIFIIIFRKIPKTRVGRCTRCDARSICYKSYYKCTCSMEEQYQTRSFNFSFSLEKIKKLL